MTHLIHRLHPLRSNKMATNLSQLKHTVSLKLQRFGHSNKLNMEIQHSALFIYYSNPPQGPPPRVTDLLDPSALQREHERKHNGGGGGDGGRRRGQAEKE